MILWHKLPYLFRSFAASSFYILVIVLSSILFIYRISVFYAILMILAMYSTIHISFLHFRSSKTKAVFMAWIVVMSILIYMMYRALMIWGGLKSSQIHLVYGIIILLQGVQSSIQYGLTFKHNSRLIQQKDDLFMRVSHSLKTPLYGIKGSIDLISNSENTEDEFKNKYPLIESSLTDLTIQINDLSPGASEPKESFPVLNSLFKTIMAEKDQVLS